MRRKKRVHGAAAYVCGSVGDVEGSVISGLKCGGDGGGGDAGDKGYVMGARYVLGSEERKVEGKKEIIKKAKDRSKR